LPNEDEILGKIITNSGGNIRQLLRLTATSSRNAQINDATSIGQIDVEDSLQELLNVVAVGELSVKIVSLHILMGLLGTK